MYVILYKKDFIFIKLMNVVQGAPEGLFFNSYSV